MIDRRKAKALALPWGGWIGAAIGWVLSDQTGSSSVFDHCQSAPPLFILLLGLLGIAAAAAGAFFSHLVWRRGSDESEVRRFVAFVGMLAAALFSIAIFLQTVASLIIPRCYG